MKARATLVLGAFALLLPAATPARAGSGSWSVGVHIGEPAYYRPWGYHPCYYRPYPYFWEPAPVIVRPVPVVERVQVVQPVYPAPQPAPAYQPAAAPLQPVSVADDRSADVQRCVGRLTDPDERVRAESCLQLGRLKAERAVDPLAATLAGDGSPIVRESAARALGLIGSAKGLPALQRAVQADPSREVRQSAQFAMDVIYTR